MGKCQSLEESKFCSCPQSGQVPWIDSVTSLIRVRLVKTNAPAKANPGTRRKWATGMKMLTSAAPQATASPFTARPMRSARSKVVTVATPVVELSPKPVKRKGSLRDLGISSPKKRRRLSAGVMPKKGAGDRIRTGDVQLGKLTFYH